MIDKAYAETDNYLRNNGLVHDGCPRLPARSSKFNT